MSCRTLLPLRNMTRPQLCQVNGVTTAYFSPINDEGHDQSRSTDMDKGEPIHSTLLLVTRSLFRNKRNYLSSSLLSSSTSSSARLFQQYDKVNSNSLPTVSALSPSLAHCLRNQNNPPATKARMLMTMAMMHRTVRTCARTDARSKRCIHQIPQSKTTSRQRGLWKPSQAARTRPFRPSARWCQVIAPLAQEAT